MFPTPVLLICVIQVKHLAGGTEKEGKEKVSEGA